MSNPLKGLFGGGGGQSSSSSINPLLLMAMMPKTPEPAPLLQQPMGSANSNKPAGGTSFTSLSAPVPPPQQTAQKSLLGQ